MRPQKIFFVRHGESEEDVDVNLYDTKTDLEIKLTEKGITQAETAGIEVLAKKVAGKVRFVLSPGRKISETFVSMVKVMTIDGLYDFYTEPLLIKQNWGNTNSSNRKKVEADRANVGVFKYKFPNGEYGYQVLIRIRNFVNQLHRVSSSDINFPANIVIISQGFELRVLLKVFLCLSVSDFNNMNHPKTGSVTTLVLNPETQRYHVDFPKQV